MKNGVETAETYIELPVMENLEPLAYGRTFGIYKFRTMVKNAESAMILYAE